MMKINLMLIGALFASCNAMADSKTVTLYEAEHMVNGGKAILVKLPNSVVLNDLIREQNTSAKDINKSSDFNATVAAQDANVSNVAKQEKAEIIPPITQKEEKREVEEKASAVVVASTTIANEGVDISMPITLSVLLEKLSKLTKEIYFCEDDLNIPSSNVRIYSIEHLDRYLSQVTRFRLVVAKDSKDPTIPKVLKIQSGNN